MPLSRQEEAERMIGRRALRAGPAVSRETAACPRPAAHVRALCVCVCVCLSVYLSVFLSLSLCLTVCLYVRLSVCLPACLSVCLSVSVCLSLVVCGYFLCPFVLL